MAPRQRVSNVRESELHNVIKLRQMTKPQDAGKKTKKATKIQSVSNKAACVSESNKTTFSQKHEVKEAAYATPCIYRNRPIEARILTVSEKIKIYELIKLTRRCLNK